MIKNFKFRGKNFFIITVILYLLIAVFNMPIAQRALVGFWEMTLRIMPILLLVLVIMTFTNLFFTKERLNKYFGEKSGAKGYLYSIISGSLIPGAPYTLYPFLGEMKEKGMTNSLLASFLFNRNVKIPFIPVLIFYFGLTYTIVLSVYIILFAVLNGIVVGKLSEE